MTLWHRLKLLFRYAIRGDRYRPGKVRIYTAPSGTQSVNMLDLLMSEEVGRQLKIMAECERKEKEYFRKHGKYWQGPYD
jgi:hypothetical protein